jgi:hypothetical protein
VEETNKGNLSVKEDRSFSVQSDSTIWRPKFPLHEIGALYSTPTNKEETISPLHSGEYLGKLPEEPTLTVYGEYLGATAWESHVPLRQPSLSESKGTNTSSSSIEHSPIRRPAPSIIHNLVQRAQRWLLYRFRDNREAPLSPSIYWAIHSLRSFYEENISQAERQGATFFDHIEDEEWPDPPSGEDNYDWSGVLNWLQFLLTMDNIHA